MQSDEVMDLIQENEAAQVEADFSAGTTSEFNFEAFDDPNARNMLGKQVKVAASFFDKGYADQMLEEGDAIAVAINEDFPNVVMPYLGLSKNDAEDVLVYIEKQSQRKTVSQSTAVK